MTLFKPDFAKAAREAAEKHLSQKGNGSEQEPAASVVPRRSVLIAIAVGSAAVAAWIAKKAKQ
jgi:hypothetical protein